jgi:hypothetical protein
MTSFQTSNKQEVVIENVESNLSNHDWQLKRPVTN